MISRIFNVNILLEILNYKLFTCEVEDEDKNIMQRKIISNRALNICKGECIFLKSLNNEIKLDIKNNWINNRKDYGIELK